MENRLTRSSKNRIITGVCGGLGEYFNIDPVIIRIFWVFITILPYMPGILLYIFCSIIIPEDNDEIYEYDYDSQDNRSKKNTNLFIGIMLIIIGFILLFPDFFRIFKLLKYWPVLLILAGIYIIVKQVNK